jgi:hypothetical protein
VFASEEYSIEGSGRGMETGDVGEFRASIRVVSSDTAGVSMASAYESGLVVGLSDGSDGSVMRSSISCRVGRKRLLTLQAPNVLLRRV